MHCLYFFSAAKFLQALVLQFELKNKVVKGQNRTLYSTSFLQIMLEWIFKLCLWLKIGLLFIEESLNLEMFDVHKLLKIEDTLEKNLLANTLQSTKGEWITKINKTESDLDFFLKSLIWLFESSRHY